ncbi:unnamed protein product [Amoebophrya sp. A120]|nr:unnamed protein product [Amoebophrya sp. A120]|eukprot:GSA120T00017732001.1
MLSSSTSSWSAGLMGPASDSHDTTSTSGWLPSALIFSHGDTVEDLFLFLGGHAILYAAFRFLTFPHTERRDQGNRYFFFVNYLTLFLVLTVIAHTPKIKNFDLFKNFGIRDTIYFALAATPFSCFTVYFGDWAFSAVYLGKSFVKQHRNAVYLGRSTSGGGSGTKKPSSLQRGPSTPQSGHIVTSSTGGGRAESKNSGRPTAGTETANASSATAPGSRRGLTKSMFDDGEDNHDFKTDDRPSGGSEARSQTSSTSSVRDTVNNNYNNGEEDDVKNALNLKNLDDLARTVGKQMKDQITAAANPNTATYTLLTSAKTTVIFSAHRTGREFVSNATLLTSLVALQYWLTLLMLAEDESSSSLRGGWIHHFFCKDSVTDTLLSHPVGLQLLCTVDFFGLLLVSLVSERFLGQKLLLSFGPKWEKNNRFLDPATLKEMVPWYAMMQVLTVMDIGITSIFMGRFDVRQLLTALKGPPRVFSFFKTYEQHQQGDLLQNGSSGLLLPPLLQRGDSKISERSAVSTGGGTAAASINSSSMLYSSTNTTAANPASSTSNEARRPRKFLGGRTKSFDNSDQLQVPSPANKDGESTRTSSQPKSPHLLSTGGKPVVDRHKTESAIEFPASSPLSSLQRRGNVREVERPETDEEDDPFATVWIDFVADTGDGFNAQYAIARAQAQPQLRVRVPTDLPRGAAMISEATSGSASKKARVGGAGSYVTLPRPKYYFHGGDIAYPSPTREEFLERFFFPYHLALREPKVPQGESKINGTSSSTSNGATSLRLDSQLAASTSPTGSSAVSTGSPVNSGSTGSFGERRVSGALPAALIVQDQQGDIMPNNSSFAPVKAVNSSPTILSSSNVELASLANTGVTQQQGTNDATVTKQEQDVEESKARETEVVGLKKATSLLSSFFHIPQLANLHATDENKLSEDSTASTSSSEAGSPRATSSSEPTDHGELPAPLSPREVEESLGEGCTNDASGITTTMQLAAIRETQTKPSVSIIGELKARSSSFSPRGQSTTNRGSSALDGTTAGSTNNASAVQLTGSGGGSSGALNKLTQAIDTISEEQTEKDNVLEKGQNQTSSKPGGGGASVSILDPKNNDGTTSSSSSPLTTSLVQQPPGGPTTAITSPVNSRSGTFSSSTRFAGNNRASIIRRGSTSVHLECMLKKENEYSRKCGRSNGGLQIASRRGYYAQFLKNKDHQGKIAKKSPIQMPTDKLTAEELKGHEGPLCFLVPGNHDWYDNLDTFQDLICNRAWLGGWYMPQTHSYFITQVHPNWFVFGLDISLTNDIDSTQFLYFKTFVENDLIPNVSRVIAITHRPNFSFDASSREKTGPWLMQLLHGVMKDVLAMRWTGDLHHYMRYEPDLKMVTRDGLGQPLKSKADAVPLIVAGGGGAFTHPTPWGDPELLTKNYQPYPTEPKMPYAGYRAAAMYPSAETTKQMAKTIPFKWRKSNYQADIVIGIAYLCAALGLFPCCFLTSERLSFIGTTSYLTTAYQFLLLLLEAYHHMWQTTTVALATHVFLLITGIVFTDGQQCGVCKHDSVRWAVGLAHALVHSFCIVFFVVFLETLLELSPQNRKPISAHPAIVETLDFYSGGVLQPLLLNLMQAVELPNLLVSTKHAMCAAEPVAREWVLLYNLGMSIYFYATAVPTAAFIMGSFLFLGMYFLGIHQGEAFVSLRDPDHKSFLRCRIGRDGVLKGWAIGIEQTGDGIGPHWEVDALARTRKEDPWNDAAPSKYLSNKVSEPHLVDVFTVIPPRASMRKKRGHKGPRLEFACSCMFVLAFLLLIMRPERRRRWTMLEHFSKQILQAFQVVVHHQIWYLTSSEIRGSKGPFAFSPHNRRQSVTCGRESTHAKCAHGQMRKFKF